MSKRFDPKIFCVTEDQTIRNVLEILCSNVSGIVFVVDSAAHLVSSLTDGDVRRALLAGLEMNSTVAEVLRQAKKARPIVASPGTSRADLLRVMHNESIRQMPVVDDAGMILSIVTLEDLVVPTTIEASALIVAGGFGTRLKPWSLYVPKPMLPVGSRPLLELCIQQFADNGIRNIFISTFHHSEQIYQHFARYQREGLVVRFIEEEQPLGTAGSIGLIPDDGRPLFVVNGDILWRANLAQMLEHHRTLGASMTVGVADYSHQVPYGVVRREGTKLIAIEEKPSVKLEVNGGLYLLSPSARNAIPAGAFVQMTDVINSLLRDGETVSAFPLRDLWMDIGDPSQYLASQLVGSQ